MDDAVRPSESAFKATYERGFRTWAALWEQAVADKQLPQNGLIDLGSAFPNHPCFPEDLALDKSCSNAIIARGKTTWVTTQGSCDLSPFQEEVIFEVASDCVSTIVCLSDPNLATRFTNYFGNESDHTPILTLAWACILSARWAELIPGAGPPTYGSHRDQSDAANKSGGLRNNNPPIVVDIGSVNEDAARWWAAVLFADGGWNASIRSDKGFLLHAPWSLTTQSARTFEISADIQPPSQPTNTHPASLGTAIRYLSDYCSLHDVADQSQAALAAALLIPMTKDNSRIIRMAIPQLSQKTSNRQNSKRTISPWDKKVDQLDRLLTLSCNSRGVRSLLNSVFFDPTVDCNVCGAWLQGTFAFLNSNEARDPQLRLQTLINRDPGLGFLWLGAFIIGAEARCLQEARAGWWKVDLSAAAWTGTQVSFIQGPVLKASSVTERISRADECRLMYLSNEPDHTTAPLFPFAPFGSTALEDTELDVHQHALCSTSHGLVYSGFTWIRDGGRQHDQRRDDSMTTTLRLKAPQPPLCNINAIVNYDNMDVEDDVSEMVTRHMFTWLRGDCGYPVAERAIREHEWVEDLESDDDRPIQGDVRSTAGGKLGGWLLGVSTKRSNSL